MVKSAHESIMYFFDHNKDGVIGFDEFVLITIALAVPEKDVEVVFDVMDLDNNGVLDEDEFMQVVSTPNNSRSGLGSQPSCVCWSLTSLALSPGSFWPGLCSGVAAEHVW